MSVSSRAAWRELRFDSFLLLSSTRVYARASATHEDAALPTLPARSVRPVQSDEAGRRGAVSRGSTTRDRAWRVCRTSTAPACRRRHSWDRCCAKAGCDRRRGVSPGLPAPPRTMSASRRWSGCCRRSRRQRRHRIYNVAAGSNTSHAAIARRLRDIAGWRIGFAPDAPTVRHPPIDTARLDAEFGPTASNLVGRSADACWHVAQECQCSPSTRPVAA